MLEIKAPPASLAGLMLQEICDHLRRVAALDAATPIAPPDLAHIERLAESAVASLDGPKSKTRRALLSQTWTATFECFASELPLRLSPVQSVTSVNYRDPNGALQTLAPAGYRLFGAGSWDPTIAPAYGAAWPEIQPGPEAVSVTFVAGYGDTLADIPAPLRQAVRMLTGHFYETREAVITGTIATEMPLGILDLLRPYRVYQ